MNTAAIHEFTGGRQQSSSAETVLVAMAPYVTIKLFALTSGLSEKAIRRKIEEGKWVENREYRRSPDGGIFVSIRGYQKWVETDQA